MAAVARFQRFVNALKGEAGVAMVEGFEVKRNKAFLFALVFGMTGSTILLFIFVKTAAVLHPEAHFGMTGQTLFRFHFIFWSMADRAILQSRPLGMGQAQWTGSLGRIRLLRPQPQAEEKKDAEPKNLVFSFHSRLPASIVPFLLGRIKLIIPIELLIVHYFLEPWGWRENSFDFFLFFVIS